MVARTGGLADTVTDADADTGAGTGFVLAELHPGGPHRLPWPAPARSSHREEKLQAMRAIAMTKDFSSGASAREYVALYSASSLPRPTPPG